MEKKNDNRIELFKRVPKEHILPTIVFLVVESVLITAGY